VPLLLGAAVCIGGVVLTQTAATKLD
jgi:hypothetical protein